MTNGSLISHFGEYYSITQQKSLCKDKAYCKLLGLIQHTTLQYRTTQHPSNKVKQLYLLTKAKTCSVL